MIVLTPSVVVTVIVIAVVGVIIIKVREAVASSSSEPGSSGCGMDAQEVGKAWEDFEPGWI